MPQQDDKERHSPLSEHDLIARYFRPLADGVPGAIGLLDDAASFSIGSDEELVVTTDALVAGVHFFADDLAADIAWKALAVNVSDLAAKAACPLAYSLALALPRSVDEEWLKEFAQGLDAAQTAFGIGLSGGDTTVSPDGPLTLSVTAFGTVPNQRMVRRNGAKAGDTLYVTGTIGDSALGLKLRTGGSDASSWPLDEAQRQFLLNRYLRPAPPVTLRAALLAHASAAMDVSDGLAIDASRMCSASGLGARIDASAVPVSQPALQLIKAEIIGLDTLLTGGDDYEILAAIPLAAEAAFRSDAAAANIPIARIGQFFQDNELKVLDKKGKPLRLNSLGYDHFRR
ncbi:MAG: thiamine-phosphate kinase [Hyphomicrobiales bacterium]|nr:thiamine-phosphate kinase [Hyphomicrobiales bacterium]